MELKNIDYTNCLTNLTCSILKYFNCEYKHNTLDYIDKILEEKKPKNIIYILYDGMGYNLLNRILKPNNFLVKNTKYKLLSVFPPTTTAATTSIITGLNPNEHGWLGWDIYVKEIDEVVTMYKNRIKDTKESLGDENICYKLMHYTSIFKTINQKKNVSSTYISPYAEASYKNLNEMYKKIKENMNKSDKNFIYAYYENPDSITHEYGTKHWKTKRMYRVLNRKSKRFCRNLKDSLVIICADHGHINSSNIFLEDYPEIFNCLDKNTSIDARSAMYFIKDGMNKKFEKLFKDTFKDNFILLNRKEILDKKIFGVGVDNMHFDSAIGDYISIAVKDKCIKYKRLDKKRKDLVSTHAGNTDDETIVPLIIIDKTM